MHRRLLPLLLVLCCLPAVAAPTLAQLTDAARRMADRSETVRRHAAEQIVQWRDPRIVPLLAPLCRIPLATETACKTLGKLGSKGVDVLLPLLNDKQRWLRLQALRGLGASDDPRALQAVRTALHHADEEMRAVALTALQLRPQATDYVRQLAGMLDDTAPRVRMLAANALYDAIDDFDPVAIQGLLDRVNDPNPEVREIVMDMLGTVRDARLVAPLCARLNGNNARQAMLASFALADLADPQSIPALIVAAKQWGDDASVISGICMALAKFSDPRTVETLVALAHDTRPAVRVQALRALLPTASPQAIDLFCEALHDLNADVRLAAIPAVPRNLTDPRVRTALLKACDSTDAQVRNMAVFTLPALLGQEALPILEHALDDDDGQVRRAALWGLSQMRDTKAANLLLKALHSTDRYMHDGAITGLIGCADPRAVPALIELLDQKSDERRYVIAALLANGDSRGVDAVLKMLPTATADERFTAYNSLAEQPNPHTSDALVEALKREKVPDYLAEIITALGYMAKPEVADAIAGFLTYKGDIGVRGAALVALARLGDPRAVDLLLKAMNDPLLKPYAQQGLALVGGPKAFNALQADAQNRRPSVKASVLPLLAQTHDPRAIEPLLKALDSPYPEVRNAAVAGFIVARPADAQTAIPPLIAAMERTNLIAEREHIGKALANLTGQNFGSDLERWQVWQAASRM